jgi:arabinofuranosyltransferase
MALALAAAAWWRERLALLLAGGLVLQVAYVVWVGGDFMSGRFLTAPRLAAALILARVPAPTSAALPAAAFLTALALATPRSPVRAPTAYGAMLDGSAPHDHIDARGVTDERAYWFHYTGLFSPARRDPERLHVTRGYPYGERLRAEGPGVRVVNGMGFVGYFAGPEPHLLDPMGLTDALLARLPVYRDGDFLVDQEVPAAMELDWRIGHFVRPVPAGYEATLASGDNRLVSPELAAYWEDLRRVVREPLLAPGRLRSIARLNLGAGEELLERYLDEPSPAEPPAELPAEPPAEAPGG